MLWRARSDCTLRTSCGRSVGRRFSRAVWGSTFVTISALFEDVVGDEPRIEKAGMDEGGSSAGRRISIYRTVALFIATDVLGCSYWGCSHRLFAASSKKRDVGLSLVGQDFTGIVIGIIFLVFSQQLLGGYRTKKALSLGWNVSRLGVSLLATFSFLIMLAAALKVTGDHSRIWFFSWMGASLLFLPLLRAIMIARRRRASRMGPSSARRSRLVRIAAFETERHPPHHRWSLRSEAP